MIQSFVLMFLSGLILILADSHSGQSFKPNVSLYWISDFEPALNMTYQANCTYHLQSDTNKTYGWQGRLVTKFPWSEYFVMEGGYLKLFLEINCDGKSWNGTIPDTVYPEVVKNVNCYIYSSKDANCSWESVFPTVPVSFFYRLVNENFSVSVNDRSLTSLQECPSYIYTEGIRTGCSLQANRQQSIDILFNGTMNKYFRNTFSKMLNSDVRPPPLQLSAKENGSRIDFSWTPPEIKDLFVKYIINYTECNAIQTRYIQDKGEMSAHLPRLPHCRYSMVIKAVSENGRHHTPWSNRITIDAVTDPNMFVYAAVLIPLLFAALALLAIVCCFKNKEHILPKVPQPRNVLGDISVNNNKETLWKLYVPDENTQYCKVSLVSEFQTNKLLTSCTAPALHR